jgi:aryl-alcohol dehydrogenase-like predicted oxidoreductase
VLHPPLSSPERELLPIAEALGHRRNCLVPVGEQTFSGKYAKTSTEEGRHLYSTVANFISQFPTLLREYK